MYKTYILQLDVPSAYPEIFYTSHFYSPIKHCFNFTTSPDFAFVFYDFELAQHYKEHLENFSKHCFIVVERMAKGV